MAPGGGQTRPLILTVTKNGNPALGAGLWLYDANGLVRDNQGNRKVFNDADDGVTDGIVTADVPVGDYGAVIKSLPIGAQLFEGIAPASPPSFTPVDPANAFAPLARVATGWVCGTPTTIEETRTDLPIEHKSPSTEESVEVTDCTFHTIALTLPGAANGDVVYLVIDATGSGLAEANSPLGWLGGVPGFVAQVQNGSAVVVCPAGSNFALELLQSITVGAGKSYNRVASFLSTACAPTIATLIPEVARCEQAFDTGIPADHPVFSSSVRSYHFTRSAPPAWPKVPDLSTSSADVGIKVAGAYKFVFRTDLVNGRQQTERTITVNADGTFSVSGKKNSGKGNNQLLTLSFQPDAAGSPAGVITAVLSNIAVPHLSNSFFVNGPGAGLPLSAREDDFAAYYFMPMPPNLSLGQCILANTNDPGWWVREP
jgi:hypothetical protein